MKLSGRALHVIRALASADPSRSWYKCQAADAEQNTPQIVNVYGEIGRGVDTLLDSINSATTDLDVNLHSVGGDYHDGLAIYNSLANRRNQGATVNVRVEGLAASMGSVIAQAGTNVRMYDTAEMMIHDPWACVIGNAGDAERMAQELNGAADSLAAIYHRDSMRRPERTAKYNASDFRTLMRDETWFSAERAVAAGLATEIIETAGSAETEENETETETLTDVAVRALAGKAWGEFGQLLESIGVDLSQVGALADRQEESQTAGVQNNPHKDVHSNQGKPAEAVKFMEKSIHRLESFGKE